MYVIDNISIYMYVENLDNSPMYRGMWGTNDNCIEDCDELYDNLLMSLKEANYMIYILALKLTIFDYFAIAQYRALHLKEINIV